LVFGLVIAVLALGAQPASAVAASLSINDVARNEGNSGTTTFTFTVTLLEPPPGNFSPITVDYRTNPGTATAGTSPCTSSSDYLTTSGQLTFNRNNLSRTVSVSVCGDAVFEPDETFFVDLSNASGGTTFAKSRGTGTIMNDDAVPQRRPTSTSVSCGALTVGISGSCTATVTDTGSGTKTTPTGTVSWGSSPAGTFAANQCTLSPTGTLGVASCSVGYTPSSAGANVVTASYGGSLAHEASQGQTTVQVAKRATQTAVTCTPGSVAAGESTNCTATVTDASGGSKSTPTGSVSWSSSGSGDFSSASCTLNASGSCSVTYTPSALGTGMHTVTGSYGGDAVHTGSEGQATVQVGGRSTRTSVSCTPSGVAVGQPTTCTATVTDTAGGTAITPTGSVSWSSSGSGDFSSASCTLNASGSCSVTYTPTAVGSGSHTVTGSYGGDANHLASSGSDTVTVTKRSTNTSVTCAPSTVAVDESTTCTATVSSGGTSPPTGSVSWSSDGSGSFSSGGSPTTSCTLNASGSCSVTYTPTAVGSGSHTVSGSYGGDANHLASAGSDAVAVTKRSTDTSVTCSPSTVAVDASTTCTATVTDSSGGTKSTPTGSVSWSSDGAGDFSSGGSPTTSCTLNASGSCSVTYTPTAVGSGSHTVTGSYDGDAKHLTSSGSDTVSVTKRSTQTEVSCNPTSFRAGGEITCTATVTDTTSGGTKSTPTGTVSWSSDGTGSFSSGGSAGTSCTLDNTGKCSITYSATKAGTDKITASYGGDAKHQTSSGFTNVTVRPGPPADVALSPAEATNTAGDEHCVTATVEDAYDNRVEAGTNVHFSVTGANPRSATAVPTDSSGQARFCYTGTKAGTDTIKAVADRDDPPNGPDAGDPSRTATKTYKPGPPANVSVAPATATNPVRTQHCVTATVTDRFENPVPAGIDVYFSVTGANPTSGKVATDANGQAKFCYTGRNGGTDTIKAVADRDTPPNGQDAGDPYGTAEKAWLSNIPCRAEGTGTISSTQSFNFGVEYFAGAAAPVGSATYIDSGQGKQFTSLRVSGLVCFGVPGGAHAIIYGSGLVNGVPVSDFQIDVDDLGSGPGTDTFAIQWPGYSAAGTLATGDIRITLR
jgi:Bacterial Ig-like domain (group 1)/Bacterial Ig-like domain (group 3)/Calx-beta domain